MNTYESENYREEKKCAEKINNLLKFKRWYILVHPGFITEEDEKKIHDLVNKKLINDKDSVLIVLLDNQGNLPHLKTLLDGLDNDLKGRIVTFEHLAFMSFQDTLFYQCLSSWYQREIVWKVCMLLSQRGIAPDPKRFAINENLIRSLWNRFIRERDIIVVFGKYLREHGNLGCVNFQYLSLTEEGLNNVYISHKHCISDHGDIDFLLNSLVLNGYKFTGME